MSPTPTVLAPSKQDKRGLRVVRAIIFPRNYRIFQLFTALYLNVLPTVSGENQLFHQVDVEAGDGPSGSDPGLDQSPEAGLHHRALFEPGGLLRHRPGPQRAPGQR